MTFLDELKKTISMVDLSSIETNESGIVSSVMDGVAIVIGLVEAQIDEMLVTLH